MRFIFLFFLSAVSVWADFTPYIPQLGPLKAGYLSLDRDRGIDNATYLYIKYALEDFARKKVDFVLLDLDTPGGEVFSALRIMAELQKIDREDKIPVVAFVDDWALSAGALLAFSCRFIGATSLASMGAAEPVIMSSDGNMKTAEEKMVSALRVEFGKAASLYGRDPIIAEAMVDKDKVVVIRDNTVTSLLTDAEILPSDQVVSSQGKLLTLDAKQMAELSISNFTVPAHGVLTGKTTIKQNDFFNREIEWISYTNWKISFFAFLSHPFVSSCFMFGLIVGLYGFVQNPSSVFSLTLGVGSLFFVLLSTFATQAVGVLEVIIFFIGLVLLLVDVFFISSGVMGAVALLLLLGGLIAMLLPSMEGVSFSMPSIALEEWFYRISLFLTSFVAALIACLLVSRFLWKKSPFMRKIILKTAEFTPSQEEELPAIGMRGKTVSSLRPCGKVQIGGKIYTAETEGEFIHTSFLVEVVEIRNAKVIVRKL
jgi:membrane-bound ClpP family serine protease